MGSPDDKMCYTPSTNSYHLEFNRRNHTTNKSLNSRLKPTPSKWDDAQKWLVGLSGVVDHNHHSKTKPRNSNAEDRRLLPSMSQKGRDSCSSVDGILEDNFALAIQSPSQEDGENKKIDYSESRTNKPLEDVAIGIRSVCLRDMGTEMTPIASKEPSRTGTPLRARSPSLRSPINSSASSPKRNFERKNRIDGNLCNSSIVESDDNGFVRKLTYLESQALAWDEAERAKYMARYKREEVKIQAWENSMMRNAELQMKRIEVKAERMKSRAEEKLANKIASARRRAEEKRMSAEAKLNEQAAKTSERADYMRKAGHVPSSMLSFKLPSLCH